MKALRKEYHRKLCSQILHVDREGVPNNADKHSVLSVSLAKGILKQLDYPVCKKKVSGQTSGKRFEKVTAEYLEEAFKLLHHLRPGKWQFSIGTRIEEFEQYEHLITIKALLANKELRSFMGDYLIAPDIVIGREPIGDDEINRHKSILSEEMDVARLTPFRKANSQKPILHASISCKWSIRSDRAQNVRTEGMNLIRNRKGNTPHIVIVTAEPYPQRISSLAMGTGDIDCVYHFALPELEAAAIEDGNPAVIETVEILVSGKRLRDISDLPFDLTV